MEKAKMFLKKHRNVVIALGILLVLLLAVGLYMAFRSPEETGNATNQLENSSSQEMSEPPSQEESSQEEALTEEPAPSQEEPATSQENTSSKVSNEKDNSTSTGNSTSSSQTTSPSQPVHQHVWLEHKVWEPNLVTVPDYETQRVPVGDRFIFAYDGFSTTDIEEAKQHAVELILAGVPDNYRTETIYETQTVQVGSHQEDQGQYVVDYYYCPCGARK